jgi:hypothetical protein
VQVLLTGAVNPSSVTGGLASGLTRVTQPQFSGRAERGVTVELLANGVRVGATTADLQGNWSITSAALANGTYAFTAAALGERAAVMQSTNVLPSLVVDTTGPSVAGVVFDARAQVLHVTLRDAGSGLNLASINNPGAFLLQLPAGRGMTGFKPTGLTVTPGALGSGEVTVNVSYNLGRRARPGGYVVTVMANLITDLAGNTLVEKHFVTFPQPTNSPNPNYVAQLDVSRTSSSSPRVFIPLAERIAARTYASRVRLRPRRLR